MLIITGTSTGTVIVGILLAGLTTSLLVPIPPKPQHLPPQLKPSSGPYSIPISKLLESLYSRNDKQSKQPKEEFHERLMEDRFKKPLKRKKRTSDCVSVRSEYEGKHIQFFKSSPAFASTLRNELKNIIYISRAISQPFLAQNGTNEPSTTPVC